MTSDSKSAIRFLATFCSRLAIKNAVQAWTPRAWSRRIWTGCAGLLLTALAASAAQMTLTWQDNSANEDGFRIERSSSGGNFMQIGTTGANVTTYVDSGLADGVTYTYRVCAYNAAGSSAYSATATGTTSAASNAAPTISAPAPVSIPANGSSGPLAFTVADAETSAVSLTVSGASSNTALVPNSGLLFGGSGTNRTVTVTPSGNQSGVATVTLSVSDGVNTTAVTFAVTVTGVNTAPTIGDIANRTVVSGMNTGAIPFTVGDAQTAAASLAVTASSSNPGLVPEGNIVLGGSGANRTIAVQPVSNQSGVVTLTVTVSDGALTASESFVLTVTAPNTAPTITDIPNRTVAFGNSTGPITFAIGDAQTSASLLTLAVSSTNTALVPLGNITLGGGGSNRTITVQPAPNQSGVATVTVTVSDGALTASDSFVLTVTAPNTAPTITAIANTSVDANTSTAPLAFTIGDAQTAAANLILSAQSSNPALIPIANIAFGGNAANRTVVIVPAANQSGSATVTVRVSDGELSSTSAFVVTVKAGNTAPTVTPVASRTIEANSSTGALAFTVGDAETPAGSLAVGAVSSNPALVTSGGLVIAGSGATRSITVTPEPNQVGVATVTVSVSDGTLTSTMTFVVTVNAVATAPTISEIADISIDVNGTSGTIPFTVSHATVSAASLTLTALSSDASLVPLDGIILGGTDGSRTVSVRPAAGKVGTAMVTIVVSDGTLSASESFRVTVNGVNIAPTISAIDDRTIAMNRSTGAIAFTIGDASTPVSQLSVTAVTSDSAFIPASGITFGGSGANRAIIVTPATDRTGYAWVTVTVSDGSLAASSSFKVTVQGTNSAPSIGRVENQTIAKGGATGMIPVLLEDADTPAASLVLNAYSSNLALLPQSGITIGGSGANRSIRLTPTPDRSGNATVTLTVSDGLTSTSASFVLTVSDTNGAPTVTDIDNITVAAGQSSAPLAFTVGDSETPAGMLAVTISSSNPTLLPDAGIQLSGSGASRFVRVTPVPGLTGTATVTLTVSDGGATARTSFVVTVTASDEAPTISNVPNRTVIMGASTGAISFVVGDKVVSPAVLTVTATSSNLNVVPQSGIVLGGSGASRTLALTPASYATGASTITLSVSNGTRTTSTSFVLTVNAPNTAPTISAIAAQNLEADMTSDEIPFTVGDSQTPAGSLTVTATVSDPALISPSGISFSGVDAARSVTLTPAAGRSGVATVTLTVSDGHLNASTSFEVTVRPKNAPPTISAIYQQAMTTGHTSGVIAFTVGDALTPAENLTVSAASSNPSLVPVSGIALGGSGTSRWLTITPVSGQVGTTTLTVTVSDGQLSASTSFTMTVLAPNSAPTISGLANRSTIVGRTSGAIDFTVDDAETPAGSLTVTGVSSNQVLLPNKNIVFGGTGESRTVTLMPAGFQTGTVTVIVTVSDGSLTTSASFVLTVTAVSTAPKISDIPNVTMAMNGNVGVAFTVSDNETAAGSLTVSAASQNTVLVPVSNIAFGGSGSNRTAIITPAADRTGTAVITISVSDGTLSISASFSLVVTAPGKVPTISRLGDRTIDANTSTGPLPFVVSDADTPTTNVVVTARSSHPSLIPSSGLVLGGTGDNRTLVVTPSANQSGNAMITLTASDGVYSSSTSFFVRVYAVNVAPLISALSNRTIAAGVTEVIGFSVSDADTPVAELTVSGSSSNQGLLPTSSIVFSGTGANRTLTLTPAPGQAGSATVTLTVSDGNLATSGSFVLTVDADDTEQPTTENPLPPDDSGEDPVIEQPGQADILIIGQPASTLLHGTGAVKLEVSVIAAGEVFYQWYAGAQGDMGAPIAGATAAAFTTPVLTATSSFWVRIYNATQSAMSQTATVTVAGNRHTYFGTAGLPGPTSGGFALVVNADNTGVFLADSPALPRGMFARGFAIAPDGSFSFDAPGIGAVSGRINGVTVSGTVGSGVLPFNGSIDPEHGVTALVAGFYQGALLHTADSEIVAVAGTSGRAFVAVSTGGVYRAGGGTVAGDGVLAAILADGRVAGLEIAGSLLSGTVSGNGQSIEVAGIRDTAIALTRVNNMSVLTHAGSGSGILTTGFTVSGSGAKKLLLRATGPALLPFGVANVLADPLLTVFRLGNGTNPVMIGQNNDWSAATTTVTQSVGAFPLPAGSKDAALVLELAAGGYTAQVTGADGSTGATLVEIYDGDAAGSDGARLTNLSVRGNAGSGDKVIVTGFIVTGDAPRRMLVRAVGPELAAYGVEGTLANPQLSIFQTKESGAAEIASNDDWSAQAGIVSDINSRVGAFPMSPGSKSSAIVLWLAPGTYTAHARSADNSTGVVIVEVYEVP